MQYRVGDTCLTKSCIMHNKNVQCVYVFYSKYINNNNNNSDNNNNNNLIIIIMNKCFLSANKS
jgi:hypothetical protein